jgi:hypothetical protein
MQVAAAGTALVSLAIDEERRRAVYVAVHGTLEVLLDALQVRVAGQILIEALHVEADLTGVLPQVGVIKRLLVLEQRVVHRPEEVLALRRGAFGCLRGVFGVRVLWSRKVTVHEAEPIAELVSDLLDFGISHATERALEVTELDERDWRRRWSHGVVPLTDGYCQASWV